MTDWKETTLEEVCESVKYGYTASASRDEVGPYFLRITDIVPRSINWDTVPYCSIEENDLNKYNLKPGDIVIARTGATAGYGKLIREDKNSVFASYLVRFRVDTKVANPLYIGSIIESDIYKRYIKSQVTGSAQPQANAKVLGGFKFPLPNINEQKRIGEILGSLDDKIELNRRMNSTLEGIGRALFKSWFVDFDPVKAKTEGHDPKLPAEMADLFPDRFEESELGPIPKGWKVGKLGDEFKITMGQSPPGKTYNENGDGIVFYQGRRDFGFRYPTPRIYCTEPKRFAEQDDALVSVRAPVGDVNMASEKCCIGRGVASVRHNSKSRSYTYYSMHYQGDVFASFEAEGTVFGSINKKGFSDIRCVIPPVELVEQFEDKCFATDQMIEVNEKQTQCLIKQRDTLLPKLLSGELQVPNAVKS